MNRLNLSTTVYGITNTRVLAITGKTKQTVRSLLVSGATEIRMEEWDDGLGTISFGPQPIWPYATGGFYSQSHPSLENIPHAAKVFQILAKIRALQ